VSEYEHYRAKFGGWATTVFIIILEVICTASHYTDVVKKRNTEEIRVLKMNVKCLLVVWTFRWQLHVSRYSCTAVGRGRNEAKRTGEETARDSSAASGFLYSLNMLLIASADGCFWDENVCTLHCWHWCGVMSVVKVHLYNWGHVIC